MKRFEEKLLNYEITDIQRQTDNEILIIERKKDTLFKIFNIKNIFEKNDFLNFINLNFTKEMKRIIRKEYRENSLIYTVYSELEEKLTRPTTKLTSNLRDKPIIQMSKKNNDELQQLIKML